MTDEEFTGSTANSRTGARLDIAANGVWGGTFERTYFDVRVFNPHAPSNRQTNLQSVYRKHEKIKKRAYEQRIREIEHATFSPLVLSATCGLAMEANTFYKRLASMLASKWDHNYSSTLCCLRCRLAFSLLRSSIQAIRGARSSCGHAIRMSTVVDLINSESRLPPSFRRNDFYTCYTAFWLCQCNIGAKKIFAYHLLLYYLPSLLIPTFPCSRFPPVMQHAGIELGPHRYDATLLYKCWSRIVHTTIYHNTCARGRSRRGTLSKMASFIVDSCRDLRYFTRDVGLEKNDRLGTMHTSEHRRSVWYKN